MEIIIAENRGASIISPYLMESSQKDWRSGLTPYGWEGHPAGGLHPHRYFDLFGTQHMVAPTARGAHTYFCSAPLVSLILLVFISKED